MRRQVVERFFRPRIGGELSRQRISQAHVLRMLAQLARGGEMEEPGFGTPRGAVQPRKKRDAGCVVALEIVVALGQAQRHQLVVVRGRHGQQRLEGIARLRVPARRKEALRALELLAVAHRPSFKRRPRLEVGQLCRGGRRQLAERIDLVQPGQRFDGAGAIAGRQPGAAEPQQQVVGGRGGALRQHVVVDDGAGRVARGFGEFARAQADGIAKRARDGVGRKRVPRLARLVGPPGPRQRKAR